MGGGLGDHRPGWGQRGWILPDWAVLGPLGGGVSGPCPTTHVLPQGTRSSPTPSSKLLVAS